jgi:DNA-binding CsgD family transcriptional regulator
MQDFAGRTTTQTSEFLPRSQSEPVPAQQRAQAWFDPSLKTIFDDLSDGVLVVNVAGHRVYSNPTLDDLVGADARFPLGTSEPPPYVAADQRGKYLRVLEGMASLLSVEGSGTASTSLELVTRARGRVRARLTISAFTSAGRGRFAVCLFTPELSHAGTENPVVVLEPRPGSRASSGLSRLRSADPLSGLASLSGVETLTRRERDVLALLLDGRRVASIAQSLFLSEHTVRNHLKAVFRKLGAHSQTELLDRFRPLV